MAAPPNSLVPCEHLTNKLRALGFTFRKQMPRVMMWKRGTPKSVALVPRCDLLDPVTVRCILRQVGLSVEDIEQFLATSHVSSPRQEGR